MVGYTTVSEQVKYSKKSEVEKVDKYIVLIVGCMKDSKTITEEDREVRTRVRRGKDRERGGEKKVRAQASVSTDSWWCCGECSSSVEQ